MSNILNFPIKYEYTKVTPGDYVTTESSNFSYRYTNSQNKVIKILVNTDNINNMDYTFYGCSSLIYIKPFNGQNVTSMNHIFHSCSNLESIPLIDMSSVISLNDSFNDCLKLKTIPLLNTSSVKYMSSTFYNCKSLVTIPPIDTSSVTNFGWIFYGCASLESLPLLDCQSVTSMSYIFGSSDIKTLVSLGGFKDLGKYYGLSGTNSNFLDKCPNLTHESLMNVINNLYNRKSVGYSTLTLCMGSTNLNKLTAEEKSIAINKGWNLS